MDYRKQFKKETGLEAVIDSWYPTVELARPEYTEWLEKHLSTIVQQRLSGSDDKSSSPKLNQLRKLASEQKDIDPEIVKIINDNFWELV